jgi:hypothetical protein
MFPVTHLYFYSLMFPVTTEAMIGAVFPDTCLNSGLEWHQSHYAMDLYNRLSNDEKRNFRDFIRGFLSHSVDSHGLDFYGDEKYGNGQKGYSYIRSESLIPDVVKACKIPESMGAWKSHNFIEMGVESLIVENHPEIKDWIEKVKRDKDEICRVAWFLSKFFPVDRLILEKSIKVFFDRILFSSDPLELAITYKCQLGIRPGVEIPDPGDIAGIIVRAREIIRDEYMDFLLECREKFLTDWRHLLYEEQKTEEKVK